MCIVHVECRIVRITGIGYFCQITDGIEVPGSPSPALQDLRMPREPHMSLRWPETCEIMKIATGYHAGIGGSRSAFITAREFAKETAEIVAQHMGLISDVAFIPGLQHLSINIGLYRLATKRPGHLRAVEALVAGY